MAVAEFMHVPTDQATFEQWNFAHAAHHLNILQLIAQNFNKTLSSYVLDPADPNDMSYWAYFHQVMHNEMNSVLGIQGEDLTDIDPKDSDIMADWVYANGNEHQQAATILGIG
jgi:hypothetical protein